MYVNGKKISAIESEIDKEKRIDEGNNTLIGHPAITTHRL